MNYRPVIGLEIHVELKTQSKMFCGCPADFFSKPPNSQTCPVCLGLPGALPVPNKKAIEWTQLIGAALNCALSQESKFDRKHYFYPDLPKGYQISQYDQPLCVAGSVKLGDKKIGITRVHLEEDTGKLLHVGDETLVDFNRSGVPLVEIVTEPDFDNSDDVKSFLEELQVIIRYLAVSDADMEKGSMRLEPNISVREDNGSLNMDHRTRNTKHKTILPKYKVEVKNINSFKFVSQAIEYEVQRQIEILENGETPIQETRGFDANKQVTYSQRTKEEAHDYRYFPEPDIPPMKFTKEYLDSIKVPELPNQKLVKYIRDFSIKEQDAFILTRDITTAKYFDECCSIAQRYSEIKELPQKIANLLLNKKQIIKTGGSNSAENFVKLTVIMYQPKKTDEKLLDTTINRLIETNKKAVEDYKKGKENALMFLVGQVLREMKGKADANVVKEKLMIKIQDS